METNKLVSYLYKEYSYGPQIIDKIRYNETMQQSQYTRGKVDEMKTRVLEISKIILY